MKAHFTKVEWAFLKEFFEWIMANVIIYGDLEDVE